jgi:hypothetical protein
VADTAAQDRLDEITEADGIANTLVEAAEVASAHLDPFFGWLTDPKGPVFCRFNYKKPDQSSNATRPATPGGRR